MSSKALSVHSAVRSLSFYAVSYRRGIELSKSARPCPDRNEGNNISGVRDGWKWHKSYLSGQG